MTQSEVRKQFVYHNPGVRRLGKKGFCYRCAHCGKWCGRPGGEKANIKDSEKMEVDHIQSWKTGGSDAMWNLQALCKPCNRAKGKNANLKDVIKIVGNTIAHPIGTAANLPRYGVRNNSVLSALGVNKRK